MDLWKKDYNELKVILEKTGWECIKDESSDLESWYSQGVLHSNFTKKDKVIHIEYGDEGDVLGEEIES
ncbi:MAG: hypothetical protein ABH868_01010 [bacterium]